MFPLKFIASAYQAKQLDANNEITQTASDYLVPALMLFLATFALYGKALGHDFLDNWDDDLYVTGNKDILGFTLEHIKNAFTRNYFGNYAPMHIISYMLDYSLWGLNATAFKLTNILLHALNVVLYYVILVRITGRRQLSLAAAAIFLCHPVQVESVVWISQRKNVLAMFFFLISFMMYLNWKQYRTRLYYVISLAAFVLALLTKSVVVILPLILICYDLCFEERNSFWEQVRNKLPYVVLAVACAVVAFYTQETGGRTPYLGGSPYVMMLNMLPVFSNYLILLFAPFQLNIIYNAPVKTVVDAEILLPALLFVILMLSLIYLFRRHRGLFFWGFLFLVGLLPVSNIIPIVTLMNDRYLYFPMLGFAAFIAHLPFIDQDTFSKRRIAALRMLFAVALVALSVVTWKRIDVWQDSLTLWGDAVANAQEGTWYDTDKNFISKGYAAELVRRGLQAERVNNLVKASDYYQRALMYNPSSLTALNNLGCLAMKQGNVMAGRRYFILLTENFQHFDEGFLNLGQNYFLTGDLDKAEYNLRRSLTISPSNSLASKLLNEIDKKRGK
ncbi:MAG: hypothetical protein WC007_08690 [Pelobacteraceae bacterium]